MTKRRQHIIEMQYAIAHNIALPEARKRLAAQRVRAAEAAFANLQNTPVVSGRELERMRRDATRHSSNSDLNMNGKDEPQKNQLWWVRY